MNDEVKLILTKLKIVSEEKENGTYICDKEHSKLLLSYIEQLEDKINWYENIDINKTIDKFRVEHNEEIKELHNKIEQLENNRDKVIEYIEIELSQGGERELRDLVDGYEVLNILKGDSDE